ncbi:hypothetical protein PanWU01x14_010090 [Parasponia andersonii]|uniref:Root meristem growth factor n=1 Tax=Parasponia andersonii TaxID=3476 RepID=A0A2P5E2N9_PARAD|nr:hypothetical protein PanWU01x14_010090 [Parasponia andersonii]
MELVMVVVTLACFFLSAFLTPCSSLPIQAQAQPSYNQAKYEAQPSLPTLSRKLRFTEEVKFVRQAVAPESTSNNKHMENVKGDKPQKNKEVVLHGSRGTLQEEWAEGTDASNFFTMDYAKVKRRRPIHNKSVPVLRP